ncbi:hypothetical protein [Phyllobacterium zundukense]|uniref:Uncharacterized protein n=1 Tax=Phyllobacterium zundukense TaxID=1867719 RepID=A0A2N9VX24_9HYPH|nr:hypothetical protein [Phyllobacterium zundukense]ATU90302.1 hypothetical protein BLM14_00425 [Phyllobacterium zundukense]PIO44042.1 hypothetical protein B5P45_15895 [Phyllobacterium zundukense]
MALSNAERQRRHRERQKQKLAAAAPDLAAQYENVGADLREKLYTLIEAENARRGRYVTGRPVEQTDFRRVILDIALNENRSGIADAARMVLLQALCMGESSEKEILEARRHKEALAARKTENREVKEQVTPLVHYVRVPNFG